MAPPRGYVIQSALKGDEDTVLVLGFDRIGDEMYLTLKSHPIHGRPTPPQERFTVREDGRIVNVQQGEERGCLTRVPVGENMFRVQLLKLDLKDPRQVWNFKAGPVPDPDQSQPGAKPGGGPHGSDKFTIVVDKSLGPNVPLPAGAILLTAQGVGQEVVARTKMGDGDFPPSEQLFFFYWLPGQ